jgi:beta-glucuronidase
MKGPDSPPHRRILRAVALGALAIATLATAAPAAFADVPTSGALYQDGPSGRFLVAGTWYRRADPRDTGRRRGWQKAGSLGGWQQTTVPNAANAGDNSARSYLGGVWWYRKDFEAPAADRSASWLLRFESVNYRATVWLNGRRIGGHTGGYLPFEVEARGLRRTGTNKLVVRVDSRHRDLDVPSVAVRKAGNYVGGWWNYAGILREVYLRKVDTLDFANVYVRPDVPCRTCTATVRIRAIVGNFDQLPANAEVTGKIAGQEVRFTPATVPGRAFHLFRGSTQIQNPKLWSPASPTLYRLVLSLKVGSKVVQTYTQHTGIRSFKVDPNGRLLLNDQPVNLRGASMTRAHYPLDELTLELADRYGILVWSEVPVYQMSDALFRRDRLRRQAIGMLRDTINRDRSHASVVVWSLGNENTTKPGPGFTRYVQEGIRLAHQLDPSRLVGLCIQGYPTVGKQDVYTRLDAIGVNDYFGWYPGPMNSIADRNGLAPYLERLHDDYPRQALFVTEFGAEANRAGPVTEKGTYAFQQDLLAYHLNVFATKPFLNGALVWILKDFRVKPGYDGGNPQPSPPLNQKGLVDSNGVRKPAFDTVKRLFAEGTKAR